VVARAVGAAVVVAVLGAYLVARVVG
jgi:hypothetical protein